MEFPSEASPDDAWIAVLGPSGVGKSYFISCVQKEHRSEDDWKSALSIRFRVCRDVFRKTVWLVEINPSSLFENFHMETLKITVDLLNNLYAKGIKFSAIIWLHRITITRFKGSDMENMHILRALVGERAISAVLFVTILTREDSATGSSLESQLADRVRPFLREGARITRFNVSDWKGAEAVIRMALDRSQTVALQVQQEMMVEYLRFDQTTLYRELASQDNDYRLLYPSHGLPQNRHNLISPHQQVMWSGSRDTFYENPATVVTPEPLLTSSEDIIVAVMGVTGAGKSSFIQHLTDVVVPVSSGLESFTENITIYRCSLPDVPKFFLIDTPGFDDTNRSDLDVLEQLADFLVTMWDSKIKLTGVVYLENILEVSEGRAPDRHLAMFRHLCGETAFQNVALVTTFWDAIPDSGPLDQTCVYELEAKLRGDPNSWAGMLEKGAKMFRHRNTKITATRVIKYLVRKRTKVVLNLQQELVDQEKSLPETAAGTVVAHQLQLLKREHEQQLNHIRQEIQRTLKERDTLWQLRIEEMKKQHDAIIAKSQPNLTYESSNISGQASAVLGNVYKNEHKTYHIENATFIFENKGWFKGLKRSRRDSPSDDDREIRSMLREFLRQDEIKPPAQDTYGIPNMHHQQQDRHSILRRYDGYG